MQQEITMTGTGQHGSVKSGRKAAARPASQRGVVTGELAIKEKKKGGLRASKSSQERADGRQKTGFKYTAAECISVSVIPERRSECTH